MSLTHGAPWSWALCDRSCLCGKTIAAANGELQVARAAADAARAQEREDLPSYRMAVMKSHVARSQIQRSIFEPAAASADKMVELLRELIRIPSVNPDQVAISGVTPTDDPTCGEHKIAEALAEKLRAVGGEVIVEDCTASWITPCEGFSPRSNVYGVWRSKNKDAKWLAIDTHIDTVMVNGMTPYGAFDATMTPDGKIHGRGACDTKATFAIVITILAELQEQGRLEDLPVNLILAGTCGEETGRLGANYFREFLIGRGVFVDELLVAEPTLCTPITAHKGGVGLRFNIKGVAAHSSKPHLGKNALVAAAELTSRFYREHEIMQETRRGPLGAPTITPTLGGGGHGPNIVPQDAYVHVDYRVTTAGETTESEDVQGVYDWMVSIAHETLDDSAHCTGFEVDNSNSDGAPGNVSFYQDPTEPWVLQLAEWSGLAPEVVTFGTNATAYAAPSGTGMAEGIFAAVQAEVSAVGAAAEPQGPAGGNAVYGTCVVMGPGDISQAHMADEWIEVSQLVKMKGVLEKWFQVA